jgi:holliday junction DNA helicase RuvA
VIGYLRGKVLKSTPETVLLDVGGVGYELHVTLPTYSEIERAGGEVELHVHTHLREDGISLFGFWTERERLLFEKLQTVSGIGPRLARVILSGMSPEDLIAALSGSNVALLSTIPGVGKKTAERMALELKDKVRDLAPAGAPAPATPRDESLVSALVNLGYKPNAAQSAVAKSREEAPDAVFEELLRASLKRLSRA